MEVDFPSPLGVKGKSADTFGPLGPWLVTPDEVPRWDDLDMWLEVDGHRYQNGSTRTMIFGVAHLSMLSGFVFFSHQIGSFLAGALGVTAQFRPGDGEHRGRRLRQGQRLLAGTGERVRIGLRALVVWRL